MPRRPPENTLHTRDAFFAREQAAWNQFLQTWMDLPEALLEQPGAGGPNWSVKDLLNHTAAWQEAAARIIQDLLAGRWARLGMNTNNFNAHHYDLDKNNPLDASRTRLFQARQTLLQLLETLSEEQLLNEYGRQQTGWWAKWNTYAHYEHHTADITHFRQHVLMLRGVSE
jgi:hypothetical protein